MRRAGRRCGGGRLDVRGGLSLALRRGLLLAGLQHLGALSVLRLALSGLLLSRLSARRCLDLALIGSLLLAQLRVLRLLRLTLRRRLLLAGLIGLSALGLVGLALS